MNSRAKNLFLYYTHPYSYMTVTAEITVIIMALLALLRHRFDACARAVSCAGNYDQDLTATDGGV